MPPKQGAQGLMPGQGTRSHMPQLRVFMKTQSSQRKKDLKKERKKESPSYILERNEQNELLASSLTLEHSPHCENCPGSLAGDRRDDTHNFFLLLFFQQKFWPRGMRFDHETSYRLKHRQMAEAWVRYNSWPISHDIKQPRRRAWHPTPAFLLGESPWTEEPGGLQSDMTEVI